MRGVWLTYYSDWSGMAVFADEIDALCYAVTHCGMSVEFLAFGRGVGLGTDFRAEWSPPVTPDENPSSGVLIAELEAMVSMPVRTLDAYDGIVEAARDWYGAKHHEAITEALDSFDRANRARENEKAAVAARALGESQDGDT